MLSRAIGIALAVTSLLYLVLAVAVVASLGWPVEPTSRSPGSLVLLGVPGITGDARERR